MTEQNRDATEYEEALATKTEKAWEALHEVLNAWLNDKRALRAVAEDCNGNNDGNCPCLYCRSIRALCA